MYRCKECVNKKSREYRRHKRLKKDGKVQTVENKLPPYPSDEQCMMCGNPQIRYEGLHYFLFELENNVAYGIWVCESCRNFFERLKTTNSEYYQQLKSKKLSSIQVKQPTIADF